MPIIFGWGKQTVKQIGITFEKLCSNCSNTEYWILSRIITWFTLFFIPIIPYSIKYFLSCPICSYGLDLDEKQIEAIRPIAEANQLLINGEITEIEYNFKIQQLKFPKTTETENLKNESTESRKLTSDNRVQHCAQCGVQINKKNKFCGNCGTKSI